MESITEQRQMDPGTVVHGIRDKEWFMNSQSTAIKYV